MATAGDIITAAFIKVGVDSPVAAQTASALISLNNMVSSWGSESLIYSQTSESFTVVASDSEYTIGSGGQWDTVRPIKLLSCFLRDSTNYDYGVKVIATRDYTSLTNKAFSCRPDEVYYVPEYPLAKIIFNASPDASYTAYFEFLKNFTEFALTSTTVTLPNEYKEALVYNLAISLGEDWDRVVPKSVMLRAAETKEVLESLLASLKPVPEAKFDIVRRNVDGYSIVTDSVIDGNV